MAKRQLYDHNGQVAREFIVEDSDPEGLFTVRTSQNVGSVLDLVADMRERNKGYKKSRNLIPVMEIPMIDIERAMREGWFHDEKKWKQYANDPDRKDLRITQGRF